MRCGRIKFWALPLLLCFLATTNWSQENNPRVVGYSPVETTVGFQPSNDLIVTAQLADFSVPPVSPTSGRAAYWGGNQASGAPQLAIVSGEPGAASFSVAIPPALRNTPGNTAIVLCARYNTGSGTIESCTNPAISTTFRVNPAPAITSNSPLPNGTVGTSYGFKILASGGTGALTFSLVSGSLPPGLSMDSSGSITGTPTQAGTFTFAVRATDTLGVFISRSFSLTIAGPLTITTGAQLPGSTVGQSFNQAISVSGGVPPYTWRVATGSTLPPQLILNSANGLLSGTLTQAANFTFTLEVLDSQQNLASRAFSLAVVPGLTITTPPQVSAATVGSPYQFTFEASGGTGPLTFSLAPGSTLPEGLTLSSTGVLTGTPAATFDGSLTVRVTDSSVTPQTAERTFTWRINTPLVWTTTFLPEATLNESYSQALQAEGGLPGYVFTVQNGSLPPGISLLSSGSLSGTPTETGSFTFRLRVSDQDNRVAVQQFVLEVVDASPVSATVTPTESQPSPNTQQPVTVTLAEPIDDEVSGELRVLFAPSTTPPVDDPALQFVTGGRTVDFTVPQEETTARFGDQLTSPPLQLGTVAGEITLQLTLRRNGRDVTPDPAPTAAIVLPAAAPTITDLNVTRTSTGLNMVIRGYSTNRTMQSGLIQFTARPGSNINGSLNFTVDLASVFTTWYSQEASFPHGSRFQLTIPVTISGDPADITGVTVRLRNQQGESNSASATF